MTKVKKLVSLAVFALICLMMTACGDAKIEKTTVFFNCDISSKDNYFMLSPNGKYVKTPGSLAGTYTISGDEITLEDEGGSTLKAYLKDDYLYYFAYDGKKDKVPSGKTFDLEVTDGRRVTMSFKSDGTMTRYIGQIYAYDYTLVGTYERKGDLIVCTFKTENGTSYNQTLGVRKGVIYECYTSNIKDFPKDTQKDLQAVLDQYHAKSSK